MTCALTTVFEDNPNSSWLREAPHNLDGSGLKLFSTVLSEDILQQKKALVAGSWVGKCIDVVVVRVFIMSVTYSDSAKVFSTS